jgi:tripartite-type tricarboxylate transporter receptor subunit TctC
MIMRFSLTTICVGVSVFAAAAAAMPILSHSQAYPSKPIRVVVPFPAGPATDLVARLVGSKMAPALGQPLVFENRAGANGAIGSEFVARSAPDGYTIQIATSSSHLTSIFLTKNLPFDPIKDFTPIIALVDPSNCLVVHYTLPVNSVKELIDYAKRNPGKLSYASSGAGSGQHLMMEQFKQATGINIVHIPYKGSGPAAMDVSAGRVETAVMNLASARPFATAGKLRILAYIDRYSFLPPDAPVLADLAPGFVRLLSYFGFYGPPGLQRPILNRLNAEAQKALNSPDVRDKLSELDYGILGGSPEEFSAMINKAVPVFASVIKAAGIQPE